MHYKREDMFYTWTELNGKTKTAKVNYILWFQDTQLLEVRNEFEYKVEIGSECWIFFNNKYNNI